MNNIENSEKINVLMAFNDGFLLPAIVSIYTLFINNNNVNLIVMYIELSSKSRMIIKKLEMIGNDNVISFLEVDEEYLKKIRISTGRWRTETFFRYFSPDILLDINKIIWLDSDILVRGSIQELFNIQIENDSFAAVEDVSSKPSERLGLEKYVNAGIILMNLSRLRETRRMDEFWALIADKNYKGELPDQDAFNIVFNAEIKRISAIWNNTPIFESEDYDYYIKNTRIVHYSSSHKPWKVEDAEYYLGLYEQYPSVSVFVPEYWDVMEKAIESVS